MLVLTRSEGEAIQVGDNITVYVVGVKGRQVKVGIDAPREVKILRTEHLERDDEAA